MAERFSITRVRLRHYRSIAACDVGLGPLTMLVGPNGSGKSNFLDSLRFTAEALFESLDNALRDRGGSREMCSRAHRRQGVFGVDLHFRMDGSFGRYAFEVIAQTSNRFRISREYCRIDPAETGPPPKHFAVHDGTLTDSSEAVMPPVAPDRLLLVAAAGIDAFRPVFDGLSAINVYNINPDAMRQLQKPGSGSLLRRDGSNVASVIERLEREQPIAKRGIEEYLSRVVQSVTGVNRRGLDSWEVLEFHQLVAGAELPWTFPATSMSDGTLRALGVLVALFGGTADVASPIGIEEPEAALHPAAAGLLLDALRHASEARQVLVTTHSPDLLDSRTIQSDEILAVRADGGVTKIGPVDEAGQRALRETLFTPGELLRVDQLAPADSTSVQSESFI